MIATEENGGAWKRQLGAVREARKGPRKRTSPAPEVTQRSVPGNRPERQHHANAQQRELAIEKALAVMELGPVRSIRRRRATSDGDDERSAQSQAVIAIGAVRLIGKPGSVQTGIEKIARAIAGEHAPGSVRSMRSRREAYDRHRRARVAKSGHRPTPVLPVEVRPSLLSSNPLPPSHEPRACSARRHLSMERLKCLRDRRLHTRWSHSTPNGAWQRNCEQLPAPRTESTHSSRETSQKTRS